MNEMHINIINIWEDFPGIIYNIIWFYQLKDFVATSARYYNILLFTSM